MSWISWWDASWAAIPPAAALAAPCITLLAYTVFGMTGFGSTLTAAPLLAHFLPLRFIVPLQMLLDFMATFVLGGRERKRVNRRELVAIVAFMLFGMVAGVFLLIGLAQRTLIVILGLFVLGYALLGLFGRPPLGRLGGVWVVPFGLVGGAASALLGTGGPFYAVYLSSRIRDKSEWRATMTATIWASAITRLAVFLLSGLLLQPGVGLAAGLLAPFALAGIFLGSRLHRRLSHEQARRVVYVLLLANGVSLLVRAA